MFSLQDTEEHHGVEAGEVDTMNSVTATQTAAAVVDITITVITAITTTVTTEEEEATIGGTAETAVVDEVVVVEEEAVASATTTTVNGKPAPAAKANSEIHHLVRKLSLFQFFVAFTSFSYFRITCTTAQVKATSTQRRQTLE